jgi:molybdate transport system permease protein
LADGEVRFALFASLVSSTGALALCLLFGAPIAWALARKQLPLPRLWRALVAPPLALPPVVAGLALLAAFGRNGLLGIDLAFSPAASMIAGAFVAMPLFVLSLEAGLREVDPRLEQAASTLGASPWRVWTTVTLPLAKPSLIAGAALAWGRALGEFGATLVFAGNLPGRTQTLPLAIYDALHRDPEAAMALACLLLAIAIALLATWRDRWPRP